MSEQEWKVVPEPHPKCGGQLSVRAGLEAQPLGTFSLAGAQMKVSAREVVYAKCAKCGGMWKGRLEDQRLRFYEEVETPDGAAPLDGD